MTKNVLILTALPFRKYGNQSLYRFVEMFLSRGLEVFVFSSGSDSKGENAINSKKCHYFKTWSFSNFLINAYKSLRGLIINKKASNNKEQSKDNFYSGITSDTRLMPFSEHNIKKFVLSWILFLLVIVDNIVLFTSLLLFNLNVLKKIDLIAGYEVNYSFASKWLSKLFNKPYINKYQGTVLGACKDDFLDCKLFYPLNYFGINNSDLCIMVNDGTNGDLYCKQRGLKNIFFEIHGVKEYQYDDIDTSKLKDIDFNKFIIFNNSSASKWKRVDRVTRFLTYLKPEIRKKVLVVTTYSGSDLKDLKNLAEIMGVNKNILFINGLSHIECNYIISKSKILLMTNDLSNLGNPVLEAVYCKTPVVSIKDGSLDNVFKGHDGAVLLDLEKTFDKKLAEVVTRLLLDKDYYKEIKTNIARNKNVFNLKDQQDKEFKAIAQLIESNFEEVLSC